MRFTVISVLTPWGAYFFPNIIEGWLNKEGGLLEMRGARLFLIPYYKSAMYVVLTNEHIEFNQGANNGKHTLR